MEFWCDTQGVRKLPEGYAKEWRLAVPVGLVLRWELMAQFHNSPTAGHPGRDNTLALVSQHYWWPRMNTWVEWYVAGCAHCQQSKIHTTKKKILHPRRPINAPLQCYHTRPHHSAAQGEWVWCNPHCSRSRMLKGCYIPPMQHNHHQRRSSSFVPLTLIPMVWSPIQGHIQ